MKIRFFVHGEPKGQPRPRAFSRGGKARVYDPGTAEGWKSQVAIAARDCIPADPITGPVSIDLLFLMPRPKGHFRSGKRSAELKPSAPRHHTAKPDADNLAKAVLDALGALGFWRDDAQVFHVNCIKTYPIFPDTVSGVAITIDTFGL